MIKYELIAHYRNDQVEATIEWDGSKIKVDNKLVEKQLKQAEVMDKTWQDGIEFLKVLPFYYKSGYVGLRRVDK